MNEILNELEELHTALQYSSEHPDLSTSYTIGERIMINQQRAALFRAMEGQPYQFIQSPEILNKTIRIHYLIERTNWVPKS